MKRGCTDRPTDTFSRAMARVLEHPRGASCYADEEMQMQRAFDQRMRRLCRALGIGNRYRQLPLWPEAA